MFENSQNTHSPLAESVRPQGFHDLLGQGHFWKEGSPLWQMVAEDKFTSLLFWGPPGTGKTSLANIIGKAGGRPIVVLSAVNSGVKEIRKVLEESRIRLESGENNTLLFMDEIHRLSKNQQDVLLPALEQGLVRFIGATTENPSFQVNDAINSRCLVFRFTKISKESLRSILENSLQSSKTSRSDFAPDVLEAIATSANGDARRALNLLEAIIVSAPSASPITLEAINDLGDSLNLNYDRDGEMHFDVISAFIKSIRASHPDAAVYYLARMIDGGEDAMFIARRLVIAASEDIGNANPTALLLATSAMQAVHMVGLPEARIILSQTTTYLASSPKSNKSYLAIDKALEDVRSHGSLDIPMHLRNAPTEMMKSFGYGKGYAYAHDDLQGARELSYLPEKLKGANYYQPLDSGIEGQLKKNLASLKPTKD